MQGLTYVKGNMLIVVFLEFKFTSYNEQSRICPYNPNRATSKSQHLMTMLMEER